jgi:hypothetical protein
VQSSSPAAPMASHDGLHCKDGRQRKRTGTHSFVELVRCHIASAGQLVLVRSVVIALWIAARRDAAVAVARHLELAMLFEYQTELMKLVVEADLLRISEVGLPVHGTNNVRDPTSVLIGELVNGVLTWEEMDSSVDQAYQD